MASPAPTEKFGDLAWLTQVEKKGPQLGQDSPIWVRRFVECTEEPVPESHPYCELGLHLKGSGIEYVEREKVEREPGDLFLAGPGVPHWFRTTQYPLEGIVIYFLPGLLCEMGPLQDGLHLLRRFTARQKIESRLFRPPDELRKKIITSFTDIHREFEEKALGHEIRLRTILLETLVYIVRWEREAVPELVENELPARWQDVNCALHYLREHFAEPIYGRDVARAAGMSESQLKTLFREALGIPWSRYLQGYRVQQAVALLNSSQCNVSEAALAVGFQSLSHFNATFRSFMGVSPGTYLKKHSKTAKV